MARQYIITVDYENNAEQWWMEARSRAAECPKQVRPLLDDRDEVLVSAATTSEFHRWASSLPEWDTGPKYARHPALILEADGDDVSELAK